MWPETGYLSSSTRSSTGWSTRCSPTSGAMRLLCSAAMSRAPSCCCWPCARTSAVRPPWSSGSLPSEQLGRRARRAAASRPQGRRHRPGWSTPAPSRDLTAAQALIPKAVEKATAYVTERRAEQEARLEQELDADARPEPSRGSSSPSSSPRGRPSARRPLRCAPMPSCSLTGCPATASRCFACVGAILPARMSFPSITNNHEFFSDHYLEALIANDLKGLRADWDARGATRRAHTAPAASARLPCLVRQAQAGRRGSRGSTAAWSRFRSSTTPSSPPSGSSLRAIRSRPRGTRWSPVALPVAHATTLPTGLRLVALEALLCDVDG